MKGMKGQLTIKQHLFFWFSSILRWVRLLLPQIWCRVSLRGRESNSNAFLHVLHGRGCPVFLTSLSRSIERAESARFRASLVSSSEFGTKRQTPGIHDEYSLALLSDPCGLSEWQRSALLGCGRGIELRP